MTEETTWLPATTSFIIRKKPKSLVNGDLERLLWSDEKSRADIIAEKTLK